MELTKEQLEAWRKQNLSNVQIAEMTGKSVATVNMLFSRYQIKRRSRALSEETIKEFCRLKKAGYGTEEIAEKTGHSENAVYRYLKAAGLIPDKQEKETDNPFQPRNLRYAKQRQPRIMTAVIHGRKWLDVTDLFIPY